MHFKAEFTKKFVIKVCFLFSTCVNEALLCKGIPLCKNKNDLKACKMNIPTKDWMPIYLLSTCTTVDHPEYIMPYGQTIDSLIDSDFIKDNDYFYCLNRGDTNPFLITNSENNETWTQLVNLPCKYDERKCLGSRPDVCVVTSGTYMLLNVTHINANANQTQTKNINTTRTSRFYFNLESRHKMCLGSW